MSNATVGVRELRDGLSRYLGSARGGAVITVTHHGKPVARITGIESESGLEALFREGIAKAPVATRRPHPTRIATAGSVSDLVAEQRR